MSSKPVVITIGLNDAPLKRGLRDVGQQMRGLQASAQQMGHGTASSMQAASASIRLLEGGIQGNIRAAERFISLMPALSSGLQAAFPLVGGLALAGVFVRIGVEAANFIKKMNEIPANPFEGLISSAKLSNDQLAISNDRLAMEIAKLEHKPVNGMMLALDQARESSDKLFESLTRANAAFSEAMGKDNIGFFKGLWNNMTPTDAANKDITSARSGVQAVKTDHQSTLDDALASGNMQNVDQARESLMLDLQKAYAQQDAKLRAGLDAAVAKQKDFQGPYSVGSDQSKVIEKYQAALAQSANEQAEVGGNYGQSIMQPKKDSLDAAKENADEAKRAQEALVQQWHKAFDEQKADFDMTLAQEAEFWNQRMEETRKGSLSYTAALDETNHIIAQMRSQNTRDQAAFDKTSAISPDSMDLSRNDQGLQNQGRDAAAFLKNLNEGIAGSRASSTAIANASLQMEVMTGRISELDAAQIRATMHTQEYTDAQKALQSALAAANALPDSLSKQAAIAGLNNQGAQMNAQRQIQVQNDQQAIQSQQLGPALQQTAQVMLQQWSNMTSAITQAMVRAADSLNDDLAKAITGHGKKADFSKTLTDTGESLVKTTLQKGESMLFGGLLGGKGKLGSSAANPMWVQMAGAAGGTSSAVGTAASAAGGLLSKIPGLGPFIQPFQGFFADGGDVMAGHPAMVGERGPEMFVPNTAGRIVPNGAMGGAGGDTHIHVDARGATDPAAVNAAIMRAAPHIVAAGIQAQHQNDKRMGRRR